MFVYGYFQTLYTYITFNNLLPKLGYGFCPMMATKMATTISVSYKFKYQLLLILQGFFGCCQGKLVDFFHNFEEKKISFLKKNIKIYIYMLS